MRHLSKILFVAVGCAASVGLGAACGSGKSSSGATGGAGGGSEASTVGSTSTSMSTLVGSGMVTLDSITVMPGSPSIMCANGTPAMEMFQAQANYSDGSSKPITSGVTWSADNPGVGALDATTGVFVANGTIGGTVDVSAEYMGKKGATTLTVKLTLSQNPVNAPPDVINALEGATTPDASVVWAYPYDGTVWPRGLLPPILQWYGGATTDVILVHLSNPTFDLETTANPTSSPNSQLPIDPMTWDTFVNSSAGATTLEVARWDGANATLLAQHTWTIAPHSMRGTIYYWSNDLGAVLRIQPGQSMADNFALAAPLNDPNQYDQGTSCLMTCHTVSADGSTLVSGGGIYGGSYDLLTGMPLYSTGGTWDLTPNKFGQPPWQSILWETSSLSPDGQYILVNSMAQAGVATTGGPYGSDMGLFYTGAGGPMNQAMAGQPVPNAFAAGQSMAFAEPAWSPDGSIVAFVDAGDPMQAGWMPNWQTPPPSDLKVMTFDPKANPMFGAPTTMVANGTNKLIAWPTISPDGKWILYSRADSADTRQGNSDLYLASATTPNMEIRLSALDGDNYPFAAGSRDLSWNYEPSFAPVAAGGYFWVVFTSRRTYGNILTGPADNDGMGNIGTKQLWVAAIDQNPQPGKDPSHPPFHLTGQNEQNLAMRGFWALPPCKGDGQGCSSGTDCCGGYCDGSGTCTPMSGGCAQDGDKCNMDSDCCNAGEGTTCINHVCSEPPPK